MRRFKLGILFVLILNVACAASEPLDYLTEDCALYIQLDKIPDLLDEIEDYAISFGLGLAKGDLANFLSEGLFSSEGFPGLDLNRPIGLFLMLNDEDLKDAVLMLPVSEQNRFRESVLSRLEPFDGAYRYADGYAFFATDKDALTTFDRGKKKKLKAPSTGQLAIYLNYRGLGSGIENSLKGFVTELTNHTEQWLGAFFGMYTDLVTEMEDFWYTLGLNSSGFELISSLSYQADGKLSKLYRSIPAGSPELIGDLPAESLMALGSRINLALSLEYLKPVWQVLEELETGFGVFLSDLAEDSIKLYGDDLALGLVPTGDKGFGLVLAIRHQGETQALYRRLAEGLNELDEIKKIRAEDPEFGFVYQEGQGGFDTFKLGFSSEIGEDKALLDFLREFLTCHIARKDGVEFWVIGPGSQELVSKIISGKGEKFRSSNEWRRITNLWGKHAKNGIMYFSLPRFLESGLALYQRFDQDNPLLEGFSELLASTPKDGGIFITTSFEDDQLLTRGLIAKNEIFGIVQLVVKLLKSVL